MKERIFPFFNFLAFLKTFALSKKQAATEKEETKEEWNKKGSSRKQRVKRLVWHFQYNWKKLFLFSVCVLVDLGDIFP